MHRTDSDILAEISTAVIALIYNSDGCSQEEAYISFYESETYKMLEDDDMKLWHESPLVLYDMRQNEIMTGDPRNSVYIRGEYESARYEELTKTA